jgi:NDP-sugar pyrophosphorylase family protein
VQGVILAGGLATRLQPLTDAVAKSMVDIRGKPFLEYQLELFKKNGVEDVVLCVGHLADQIRARFGDGAAFGVRIRCSDDGARPMGTAGALKKAETLLSESFFVLDGDSYLPFDYRKIMTAFEAGGREALMVVHENHDRYDKSNAAVAGNQVTVYDRARKTPGLVHIHAGLSVLRREALASIPADRPSSQDELWADLISRGQLTAFVEKGRFYEIGSPLGLTEFREHIGANPC